eukprot:UN31155
MHQYAPQVVGYLPGTNSIVIHWFDIIDYSCLNAWTGGNSALTSQGLAQFWYDVYSSTSKNKLLSEDSLKQQMNWHEVDIGTYKTQYGQGLMVSNDGKMSV